MSGSHVGCSNHTYQSNHPNTIISSEMDYSLLASDMQKLLNISHKDEICWKLSRETFTNKSSHLVVKKTRSQRAASACLEDIESYKCPLCFARYNDKYLLAKHALRIHQRAVVALLQEGSTEQHLKCRFCVHKVMHKHQKLLLLHLEKKHATEFVSYFKQSYQAFTSIVPCDRSRNDFPQCPFIENTILKDFDKMSALVCKENTNSVKNVKKDQCESEVEMDTSMHKPENFDGTLCMSSKVDEETSKHPGNQMPVKCHAKRKLVLDGTICNHVKKAPFMKENMPPNELFSMTLAMSSWKHAVGRPFACGRCKESFSCNALLLDHVSVRHRGPLRLLQPLFTCGLCSASFYKNSFLVRHCYQHHTPKQLD